MTKQIINTALLLFALSATFTACKKKEQPKPEEQELITTLKLTISDGVAFSQAFVYKVENGFGGITGGSVQVDTLKLAPGKAYTVTAELFNEKATPAENITQEVSDERNAHLFLYQSDPVAGAGSIAFSGGSKDFAGLPFNQVITFTTGAAGSGSLQVNLMHEPSDKNGATPVASGGETDVEAIFPVMLQ